jgi:hypothetical protein
MRKRICRFAFKFAVVATPDSDGDTERSIEYYSIRGVNRGRLNLFDLSTLRSWAADIHLIEPSTARL